MKYQKPDVEYIRLEDMNIIYTSSCPEGKSYNTGGTEVCDGSRAAEP